MTDELVKYISQYVLLNEEEIQLIKENIILEKFQKKSILLREGQISDKSYFVLKGCIRQYHIKEGEEKTTFFYTEQQSVSLFVDPFNRKPSPFFLSCIEDTTVVYCKENADALFMNYPKFNLINQSLTEHDLNQTKEEFAKFIASSPEERYLNLLESRPDLLNRVPQHQLASYLGMKAETLSRIKKRIWSKVVKKSDLTL